MHPHYPRGRLRYLLLGLLIAALIFLFPITARSHQRVAEIAVAAL